jgi:ribosome-interacting GTPase 1
MRAKTGKVTTAKKTISKKNSALEGEGSYTAARNYDRETESFIVRNKSKISKLAKEAEKALQGPEGKKLRAAERVGRAKVRR